MNDLLGCLSIVVESRDVVARALAISANNSCDFADSIVAASALNAGCAKTLSFDPKGARAGMTLLR